MTDRQTNHARFLRAGLRQRLSAFVQKTFTTLEPGKPYAHNWHLDHLAWQLARVERGEIRRLIINVPPRSGKSITVSVAFTAWLLGRDPTKRVIAVSYAEDLARKLSLDTRRVMQSEWFTELFPACELVRGRQRTMELTTTQQGGRFAAGVGGSVLGRGADLIVIDDPIKALDALSEAERRRVNEFYDNTLLTRLNDKQTGAIVLVMQRLHQSDLVGYVRARGDWEVVSLPAIAVDDTTHRISDDPDRVHVRRRDDLLHPEREPRAVLDEVRRGQGSMTFAAQYQQEPMPPGGNVIQRAWLRFYDEAPPEFDRLIASWDTASTLAKTSDWSVGTVWGAVGQEFYLLDVLRDRLEAPALQHAIINLSADWQVGLTLIENTELGRALAQHLFSSGRLRPKLNTVQRDKLARLLAVSARFEAGQVLLPREAPWLATYMSELLAFPNGDHDDQVDSTSQALRHLTERQRFATPRVATVRRNIPRR